MSIFADDENETTVSLEETAAATSPLEDAPFRLLLLGEWSSRDEQSLLSERSPIEIDRDNFDEVMRALNVEISLAIDGENSVRLDFKEIEDFHPDRIYSRVPLFADLRETRRRLQNPHTFRQAATRLQTDSAENKTKSTEQTENQNLAGAEPVSDSGGLLDQILAQTGGDFIENASSSQPKNELEQLINRLVRPFLVEIDEAEQTKFVAALDQATGQLMRTILHHPQFQKLESAWRAAHWLVMRTETSSNLKIYLFEAAKDELKTDLKAVGDLSAANFFKLLNNKNLSSPNEPNWAAVCGNYTFEPNVEDTALLMRLAKIARAAETVFIAQASSKILGADSAAEIAESDDWLLPENSAEGNLWKTLRESAESSSIGLTFPRFLGRAPYGAESEPIEAFSFEEIVNPRENGGFLWLNSAFACALLITQSFSAAEWNFGRHLLRDITGLPLYIYRDGSQKVAKPLTETVISVKTAEKMIDAGLMPLVSFRDEDRIRLARFQSIASPPKNLSGPWNS